jgi:hypothetical protein
MDTTESRRNDRISQVLARGACRNGMRKTGELTETAADIDHATRYAAASASWMPLGACLEEDPELFFPVGPRASALASDGRQGGMRSLRRPAGMPVLRLAGRPA